MGQRRENRLSLRRLDKVTLAAALIAGAALPPASIASDSRTLFVTFLGLISASILPTISLLLGSMTASGRSVLAINKLQAQLEAALDALFFLFGCAAIAVASLVALSLPPPAILTRVPYLTSEILPRAGQMMLVTATAMIVLRAGQIPGILRQSLRVRHEIAVAEARLKTAENAPNSDDVRKAFSTHPDFGKVVSVDELKGREPH